VSRGRSGRRTGGRHANGNRAGGGHANDNRHHDGNWIDPAEAGCRLIVQVGAASALEPLLGIDAVAALLLEVSDEAVAQQQVRTAHATGRAAFLVDRVDLVRPLGADGVFLHQPSEVAAARRVLDQGELIGAAVGATRHDAMVAGEDGADYVLFGTPGAAPSGGIAALAEHVAWWSEVAVLPAVVAGRFAVDEVRALARAGADFILPATDGDAEALEVLAAALAADAAEQR
jgi:thiamine-phosphate pyrophosphorylase